MKTVFDCIMFDKMLEADVDTVVKLIHYLHGKEADNRLYACIDMYKDAESGKIGISSDGRGNLVWNRTGYNGTSLMYINAASGTVSTFSKDEVRYYDFKFEKYHGMTAVICGDTTFAVWPDSVVNTCSVAEAKDSEIKYKTELFALMQEHNVNTFTDLFGVIEVTDLSIAAAKELHNVISMLEGSQVVTYLASGEVRISESSNTREGVLIISPDTFNFWSGFGTGTYRGQGVIEQYGNYRSFVADGISIAIWRAI